MAVKETLLYTPRCEPYEFPIGVNQNAFSRHTLLFRTFNTLCDCCIFLSVSCKVHSIFKSP